MALYSAHFDGQAVTMDSAAWELLAWFASVNSAPRYVVARDTLSPEQLDVLVAKGLVAKTWGQYLAGAETFAGEIFYITERGRRASEAAR